MKFLFQAFSEANGSPSSMRLLTGAVVLAWLAVFIKAGWMLNAFPAVTPEQLGVLAVALGAKLWQKGRENGGKHFTNSEPPKSTN